MKKLYSILLVLLLVFALGACVKVDTNDSNSKNSNSDAINPTIPDELTTDPITITFWHTYGEEKEALLKGFIKQFTDDYPNVTVNAVSQGSYDDLRKKTVTSISTGATPTMLVGYPDHFAEYMTGNAAIALDDYINHEEYGVDLDDFIDSYVEENDSYADGYMYTMPFSKSTEMMVYNKTVFDHHGIEISNTEPITYAQLETYANTIVGSGDYQCEYLANYDSSANLFINATRQWDGGYTNSNGDVLVDNANTKAMLTYMKSLFDSKAMTLPIQFGEKYGSGNFKSGDVCMTIGSTAGISYNIPVVDQEGKFGQFEVGVAPIPQKAGGTKSVVQQGPNIGIMANTTDDERLASWILITYLINAENTTQWAMTTGYLPVRESAFESDTYKEFLTNPDADYIYESKTANAAYAQVDWSEFDPAFAGRTTSANTRVEAGLAMEAIYADTKSIQQAIDNMIAQLVW